MNPLYRYSIMKVHMNGSEDNARQSRKIAKQLARLAENVGKLRYKPRVKHRSLQIRCPATSANLGPGFDVFALALSEPYDIFRVDVAAKGISLKVAGLYGPEVPAEPDSNVAGFVARHMLETFGISTGLSLRIRKMIRPGGGLGSSAASAAAAACAIDRIFGLGLDDTDLIEWAALGEMLSGGDPHVDNVAAAYLGGFIIVTRREPLFITRYDPHPLLCAVLAIPDIAKSNTRAARAVLGPRTAMTSTEAMRAIQEACGIITGRIDDIVEAMRDLTHIEERRESEGFYRLLTECKSLGTAFKAGIAGSGAGPSIIAITKRSSARPLSLAMKQLFENAKIDCQILITRPSTRGIKQLVKLR